MLSGGTHKCVEQPVTVSTYVDCAGCNCPVRKLLAVCIHVISQGLGVYCFRKSSKVKNISRFVFVYSVVNDGQFSSDKVLLNGIRRYARRS